MVEGLSRVGWLAVTPTQDAALPVRRPSRDLGSDVHGALVGLRSGRTCLRAYGGGSGQAVGSNELLDEGQGGIHLVDLNQDQVSGQ